MVSNRLVERFHLTQGQLSVVEGQVKGGIFLEGLAGCGKTTVGVERMLYLMASGVRGDSIMVLVPQRTLAEPYYRALRYPGIVSGGMVTVLTVGGLARRMIDLYWPLVGEQAGFARPDETPTFLNLESAQYYMAHQLRPLFERGFFESVKIDRNRLYSQILDNMNKAAVTGFPHTEIVKRLSEAWAGESERLRIYQDVQDCVDLFRSYCMQHNLLDYSLQIEIFRQYLWENIHCRDYLQKKFRHLIFDNLEEDTPVAHDLLADWLSGFKADGKTWSALLIYDHQAGFRSFLGADPGSAYVLKTHCDKHLLLEGSFVSTPPVAAIADQLVFFLKPAQEDRPSHSNQFSTAEEARLVRQALTFEQHHYYPQMLDWVADRIASLVKEDSVAPSEIVVLAPFLSDALRFSILNRLEVRQIPSRSHRPSRSLREEPATHCLLTLAMLAYPQWGLHPTRFDLVYALVQAIDGLDLNRAQLLAEIVFRVRDGAPILSSFDLIKPAVQERITYRLGERYERLRLWLAEYTQYYSDQSERINFDHFLSRMFGELLSQPGFGFHTNYQAGQVAANLIESVQKFRWSVGKNLEEEGIPLGKEYLLMVKDGVIAAQSIRSWQAQSDEAVLVAPAYTFLMSNRPVDVQFWLDLGSRGWYERLNQPLTHPYVLARNWQPGKVWTDSDEVTSSNLALYRLAIGLLRRCRRGLYLGISELGEHGYEGRGALLQAFQRLLRRISTEAE